MLDEGGDLDTEQVEEIDKRAGSQDYVNSFARGLEVIRVFTRHKPRMTLSEVAQETDMTRATVRRFLLTLVREGYVEAEGRYFSLLPKVLDLGFSVLSSMDIWDVAQPIMNELSEKLQESVMAAVFDKDSVIYLARAFPNRMVTVGIRIGHRMPAHVGATGRVLLAALSDEDLHAYLEHVTLSKITSATITSKVKLRGEIEKARRQGFAIVDGEMEVGLRSISVPIYDLNGKVSAGLNVGCPTGRVSAEDLRGRILHEMLEASRRITDALRG
jgi:IclR family pca regulon transcriptional regulator